MTLDMNFVQLFKRILFVKPMFDMRMVASAGVVLGIPHKIVVFDMNASCSMNCKKKKKVYLAKNLVMSLKLAQALARINTHFNAKTTYFLA